MEDLRIIRESKEKSYDMLPEVTQFQEVVPLIDDTGIQFLDFALTLDPNKMFGGEFIYATCQKDEENASLKQVSSPTPSASVEAPSFPIRLLTNEEDGGTFFMETKTTRSGSTQHLISVAKPALDVDFAASLSLFDGKWVPLPFFRHRPPAGFDDGPNNWARMRLVSLDTPDVDGATHRLTLAFDTRTMPNQSGVGYLAPSGEDVRSGDLFKLALTPLEAGRFVSEPWVTSWLNELYREGHPEMDSRDIDEDLASLVPQAHYLNLLSLMWEPIPAERTSRRATIKVPEIRLVGRDDQQKTPIDVDLVLDVGNSRTCGILIEHPAQSESGLKHNYVLELRDLVDPERVYSDSFESRVEFSQSFFGKNDLSVQSGRPDAFRWPTIARVGREAGRLASRRRGTEGSTGLSSPKRYLWDRHSYTHGWRFNGAYVTTDREPFATAPPFSNLINERGKALFAVLRDGDEDDLPVFRPHYSRSSMMTFMLSEVLAQALMQINSPAQRSRQGNIDVPRRLRSILLTVPPAMPLAERSILFDRMREATGLIWQGMGWYDGEDDPFAPKEAPAPVPPLPDIHVRWDEATCGQLVYLYTEINENFAGHPEEFFATLARPEKSERDRITVASIDIGGGTTDLVITDYRIDDDKGNSSNVHIVPQQRFRDGFRIAGDDILLDVIQGFVLKSFEQALAKAGVGSPDAMMSRLLGGESLSAQDKILRQQLTLQVFSPLGLEILRRYEQFDPEHPCAPETRSYGELVGSSNITDAVENYVLNAVRRDPGSPSQTSLRLSDIPLTIDLTQLHRAFLGDGINIGKSLGALCEVVNQYHCDMLLITGRPSRLPGVQAFLRKILPLPPGRILPMHGYRTGNWYPFHRNGAIDDPKTTAAVGAMLCLLCSRYNLPQFYFHTKELRPFSLIRHLGTIDNNNVLKDTDVVYRDIETVDDGVAIKLPDDGNYRVQLRGGIVRLGFRQLDVERWVASPLYILQLTESGKANYSRATTEDGSPPVVWVELEVNRRREDRDNQEHTGVVSDQLSIRTVGSNTNRTFNKKDVTLELNTMIDAGLGDSSYWLDSGSVKRK